MFELAHVAGSASGFVSRRIGSRHGRVAAGGSWSVLRRSSGKHRGGGLQRHFASASSLVCEIALGPQHFSGGPSRACGWAAVHPGSIPAASQARRTHAAIVAASRRSAVNLDLALAKAASDNKSMHTDTQVLAASRLRFQGAGDLRRYRAKA